MPDTAPGRRASDAHHAKLVIHLVDFSALPPLPADEVYLALGPSIRTAGSTAAFRAVDRDATLAVARAALSGAMQPS